MTQRGEPIEYAARDALATGPVARDVLEQSPWWRFTLWLQPNRRARYTRAVASDPPPAPCKRAALDADDERLVIVERREWLAGQAGAAEADRLAREEPLELRVHGVAVATVMRTPGHDVELVRGFLLSERVVAAAREIASIRHCTTVTEPEAEDNVVLVQLADGCSVDLAALRRNMFASSSCGVCGKASIAAAMALPELPELAAPARHPALAVERLYAQPQRLRAAQPVFAETGGLHAAGLFTSEGELLVVREDVGRHNAVDKVIGWSAAAGVELGELILQVSGRVSFEITQKAVAVGIPVICAVSAPTSLAVELARRAGITLTGFMRGRRLCVYAGESRLGGGV